MKRIVFALFLFFFLPPLIAQDQTFAEWREQLRAEAFSLGISEETLLAIDDLEAPLERVLELDDAQPEFIQTFTRYLSLRITPLQINRGQALLRQYAVLLEEVRQSYGVQPHYLVSFWAIESNYGRATGGFSVLQALATLAFDPRRADFFRTELLTALKIIDDGHIAVDNMSGSWAGAMGQLQFLPSVLTVTMMARLIFGIVCQIFFIQPLTSCPSLVGEATNGGDGKYCCRQTLILALLEHGPASPCKNGMSWGLSK